MRKMSFLLLLPVIFMQSCITTKGIKKNESQIEKPGVMIGRIDGMINITEMKKIAKCEELILMDYYTYKEISVRPDENGFFMMPVSTPISIFRFSPI